MIVEQTRGFIRQAGEEVRHVYGGAIGRHRTEVVTPALLLDIDAAQGNIEHMAERLGSMPAVLRPHVKVHKSPELARRQVAAGAIGVSVATVWEAAVMVAAGIDHVLLVNTIADDVRLRTLGELALVADILVAVDEPEGARRLSRAMTGAGATIGVLVEVDTGMGRAGIRDGGQALDLASLVGSLPGLSFLGLTGYEGHCSMEPDAARRAALHRDAMTAFIAVADHLVAAGVAVPILSAGGTMTWLETAQQPRITEIQAGSYVLMDAFHGAAVTGFQHALTVASTVISRTSGRLVIDAGSKTIADADLSLIIGHPRLRPVRFDEEHGILRVDADGPPLTGERLEVVPGYAPSTVNAFDAYHVIRDDMVVDIWPVIPRGPGHHGLAYDQDQ